MTSQDYKFIKEKIRSNAPILQSDITIITNDVTETLTAMFPRYRVTCSLYKNALGTPVTDFILYMNDEAAEGISLAAYLACQENILIYQDLLSEMKSTMEIYLVSNGKIEHLNF